MSYELQRYLSFIGIFLNLFLGLLALTHTRKNPLYRSFFLMNFVLFFWNFSHFSNRAIFISERVYILSFQCSLALIPAVILHFIYRMITPERKKAALMTAYGISLTWCGIFIFTRLIDTVGGVILFGASMIALLYCALIGLARSIRTIPGGQRKQCEIVVLVGLSVFLFTGILEYLVILIFNTYPFLSILGALIFSGCIAWAVFTYHLFDLKNSLYRALGAAGILIAIYLIYLLISGLFSDFPGMKPLAFLLITLGIAFLLSPIGPRRPRELLHRFFFPDKITLVDIINRFISELPAITTTKALTSSYLKIITAALPGNSGMLYLAGDEGGVVAGYSGQEPLVLEEAHLRKIADELTGKQGLISLRVRWVTPNDKLLVLPIPLGRSRGFFILNGRKGSQMLSAGEKRFLEIITSSFAAALIRIREREEKTPAPPSPVKQFGPIIGGSPSMLKSYSMITRIAPSDSTVLIQGESGTGKELIAQMIHNLSGRGHGPFIAVNCATLTGDLLKSELFGHEKGAFTGAVSRRIGRFEQAHGGTIFLDEIGEIPLPTQAMLLRVIENKTIMRLGGQEEILVNARILAATNRDLAREVTEKSFREDLFYRLNVIPITAPHLRERGDDIPLLVDYFIRQYTEEFSKNVEGINRAALRLITNHDWPGNVRELSNVIERAVLMADSKILTPDDIALEERPTEGEFSLKNLTEESVKNTIRQALKRTGGNVTRSARLLGISRVTLQKKMKKYDLRGLLF
jgi:DNA-binding NtrC family response regulator